MAQHAAKIEHTGTIDGSNEAAMNVEECRGSWLEIRLGLSRLQPLNWSVG
jgi:hypothetical protein